MEELNEEEMKREGGACMGDVGGGSGNKGRYALRLNGRILCITM